MQTYQHIVTITDMEPYLKDKRDELVWALLDQGYNGAQISRLFGTDRVTIKRIKDERPEDYKVKWVKVR